VLIDFGLTLKENENQCFQDGSTRHYSPESCLPPYTVYTSKSDVWSFGNVLYETMNGGDLLFGMVLNKTALKKLTKGEMPEIDEKRCNAKYVKCIQKCWTFDVEQRITAQEASDILLSSL